MVFSARLTAHLSGFFYRLKKYWFILILSCSKVWRDFRFLVGRKIRKIEKSKNKDFNWKFSKKSKNQDFKKFRFSKIFNWNPCLSIFRFLKMLPTCTKMLLSSLLINRFSKIRILHKLQNTHYPFRRPTEVGGRGNGAEICGNIFFPVSYTTATRSRIRPT